MASDERSTPVNFDSALADEMQTTLVSGAPPAQKGGNARLVLFDIDGTILASGGAGIQALHNAVRECFGDESGMAEVEVAGRTDSGIARQILQHYRQEETQASQANFLECYLRHLEDMLPKTPGRLLPGIVPLLEALQKRSDIILGLLTGNLARGAELKLRHYGVWHFFGFGAYADDHHDRNELGRFATARVLEKHGLEIPGARTFVIGDTPHDIACGNAMGAQTVGVATGIFTRAQLAAYHPDFLFDDLSDLEAVLRIF